MNEHYNNLNKLFEIDNIKKILDAGSGRTSLNYLIKKYPTATIDAIVYPGDERKINSIKQNVKGSYKLLEKDICKDDILETYDLVLAHLLLGEATTFNNLFKDLLKKLLNINSKYFLIYDYKEDPHIDYDFMNNFIKENDFCYVDFQMFEKLEPQVFSDFIGKNYCAYLIKRIDLVDIVYGFVNDRYDVDKLLKKLNNIRLCLYKKTDQEGIVKLINEIKNLTDKEKIIDILINNEVYLNLTNNMSSKDLLIMISQYIYLPNVPNIDNETFDEMVEIAIKYNDAEKLWRLAFNYEHSNNNFNKIIDYYIEVKNSWYLSELVYAVGNNLDKKYLISKLLKEKDKKLVKDFLNSVKDSGEFSEEQIKELENQII